MNKHSGMRAIIAATVLIALTCGACARTKPARFYLLTAHSAAEQSPSSEEAPGLAIRLGPVTVAEYLDRPQIVTRTGRNEVALADFDRWAEPLEDSMARVMRENLAAQPGVRSVTAPPATELPAADLRVAVHVLRLDIVPGRSVELQCGWAVRSGDARGNVLKAETTTVTEPIQGEGYGEFAAAASAAVAQLCEEIGRAIEAVE